MNHWKYTVGFNPEWRRGQVGHYCINCRILLFSELPGEMRLILLYCLKLVRTPLNVFYFAAFKINFLSLCTYIPRMDVMLDFICMGTVDLSGVRRKLQNTKWKFFHTAGLEPSTLRLEVWCSTNWASRACWMLTIYDLITYMYSRYQCKHCY